MQHNRQAKGDEDRGQDILAQYPVEQQALAAISGKTHNQHHQPDTRKWVQPEHQNGSEDQIGGDDDEIAMRDIHEPHYAEHQGQSCRKECVETAQQNALYENIDQVHYAASFVPK